MHSSPHPSPVTGSGCTTDQDVILRDALRFSVREDVAVDPVPHVVVHARASLAFFKSLLLRVPTALAPGRRRRASREPSRRVPCSSASCCALSRMSISSLSISCGASHVSYRESLFSLQNLRREARRVAESAGLRFGNLRERRRRSETALRSRESARGRGGGRGARGARARRGRGAAPRSRRSGPNETGPGKDRRRATRRPARGTRVGRRENVGPRRRERGDGRSSRRAGVRTTARRPPGARRPPSARGATARNGRTAPTRRSTAAGAARPARGSGRPRRPVAAGERKVRFFSRSFPDRDLTRAARGRTRGNAIRARSLASTREWVRAGPVADRDRPTTLRRRCTAEWTHARIVSRRFFGGAAHVLNAPDFCRVQNEILGRVENGARQIHEKRPS